MIDHLILNAVIEISASKMNAFSNVKKKKKKTKKRKNSSCKCWVTVAGRAVLCRPTPSCASGKDTRAPSQQHEPPLLWNSFASPGWFMGKWETEMGRRGWHVLLSQCCHDSREEHVSHLSPDSSFSNLACYRSHTPQRRISHKLVYT